MCDILVKKATLICEDTWSLNKMERLADTEIVVSYRHTGVQEMSPRFPWNIDPGADSENSKIA